MNAAKLKSPAHILPADVVDSVSRVMLHVRRAAGVLGSNTQSPDLPAVVLGCASSLVSLLVSYAITAPKDSHSDIQRLQEAVEGVATSLDSGLSDIAEAIRGLSDSLDSNLREQAEATRRIGDECKGVDVGVDALRTMLDRHLEIMHRRMAATGVVNDARYLGQKGREAA